MTDLSLESEMHRLAQMLAASQHRVVVRAINHPVVRSIPHAAGKPLPATSGEPLSPSRKDPGVVGTSIKELV